MFKLTKGKSILDLSFVILCATFFSLLLTDSLIISGRDASYAIDSIIKVFFYTFFVVGTLFAAWLFNQSEKVVGFWAVTTLIVLIIAPGGPFNRVSTEKESGLSVYIIIPVAILLVLATTTFIYSFGNPLSNNVTRRNRILVFLSISAFVIFAAIAVGIQFDNYVSKDARTPRFENPQAKELTRKIMKLPRVDDKRLFYQLASELSLGDFYLDSYYKSFSQPTADTVDTTNESKPEPAPASSPTNKENALSSNTKSNVTVAVTPPPRPNSASSNTSVANTNSNVSKLPSQPQKSVDEADDCAGVKNYREYLSNRGSGNSDLYTVNNYIERECRDFENKTLIFPRLKRAVSLFYGASGNQKSSYLLSRIPWVHPAGIVGSDEAMIPLPHRILDERFRLLSDYRLIAILRDEEEKARDSLFRVYTYPKEVQKVYGKARSDYSYGYEQAEERENERTRNMVSQLYPRFQENDVLDSQNKRLLRGQLSMPLEQESAIAYKHYQIYSREYIRNSLGQERVDPLLTAILGNEDFQNPTPGFDENSQRAINFYVAKIDKFKKDFEEQKVEVAQIKDIVRMLAQFKHKNIDFSDFISSKDPTKTIALKSCLISPQPNMEPKLKAICEAIKANIPLPDKTNFQILLDKADPSVPIDNLLSTQILGFAEQLNDKFGDTEKENFMLAVSEPIWYSVRSLSDELAKSDGQKASLPADLQTFYSFGQKDREAVLHQLAITLFKPGGEHSLNPISSMIAQFRFWHEDAGWVCATILCSPFLFAFTILGGYFARILVSRDRLREVIDSESSEYSNLSHTIGTPIDKVFGRTETLNKLKNLAERGWSTIGVVGRRGVGKSRILHTLSTETDDEEVGGKENRSTNIRVWISSPSKFSEYEFVVSIFERFALSTEEVIARFLGAKPLGTRTIESKIAVSSTWVYVVSLLILGWIVFLMFDRLSRWDIAVIWIPILVLLFSSICLFANYISKIQPVNLTSWLQRERNENPHTYLLYRDVYKVLSSISNRVQPNLLVNSEPVGNFRVVALTVLTLAGIACILLMTLVILNAPDPYIIRNSSLAGGLVFVIITALWIYLYRKQPQAEETIVGNQSLMSLIVDYRTFASTVIYRLNRGALNYRGEEKFAVLLCIDELDKIVDFEEIRSFLRRIKAIFEVPGLYYYISIAEDTMRSLYLGATGGKNEIDSSFDHIVRIPPLTCDESEAVAAEYLDKIVEGRAIYSRQARLIAAVSFGIPRDIIRRCDEFLSANRQIIDAQADTAIPFFRVESEMRKTQIALGYELQKLTSEQVRSFASDAVSCAEQSRELTKSNSFDEFTLRLILSIWLLALIEIATDEFDDDSWVTISREFCELGYKLPELPPLDLINELNAQNDEIMKRVRDGNLLARQDIESPK
ncbi:MAG TPA: hypothetical protein VGC97_04375 [Pyrinomonadaceae bacterium]